jgi:hypothetical protein
METGTSCSTSNKLKIAKMLKRFSFTCVWVIPDGLGPNVGGAQGDAAANAIVGGHLHTTSCGGHVEEHQMMYK